MSNPHLSLRLFLVVLGLSLPALPAAGQGVTPGDSAARLPRTGAAMAPQAASVDRIRRAYVAAYNRRDAAAVSALYAADGVLVSADGSILRGRRAIGDALRHLADWPTLKADPGSIRIDGSTAWQLGVARSTTSDSTVEVDRYLAVLAKRQGTWRIEALMVVTDSAATARAAGIARR